MALSLQDGTKQKTLDILSKYVGIPIKYARVYARWVTRDNHPQGAFTANLDCYVDEHPTLAQATPLHYEIGCNLPEDEVDKMATMDDRAVLYKHIEYILHYQDAKRNVTEENKESLQSELDNLSTELGIQTLFKL